MRRHKDAGPYQFRRVLLLDKPHCGEEGLIVGFAGLKGEHIRKPRSKYSRPIGRRRLPKEYTGSAWYKVLLLDTKWGDKVIKVPDERFYYLRSDQGLEDEDIPGTYEYYPAEDNPQDFVTRSLLESALERKMARIHTGQLSSSIPLGSRRELDRYSRQGRSRGRG